MAKKSITQKVAGVAKTVANTAGDQLGGYASLRKSLDDDDHVAVEEFCVRKSLPLELVNILFSIRPEAERLRKIIETAKAAENVAQLKILLDSVHTMVPQTMADAEERTRQIIDIDKRIRKATAERLAGDVAQKQYRGLRCAFSELLDGTPSKPLSQAGAAGLPTDIHNAIIAAGLPDNLGLTVWTEAFRRQPETRKRRRLVALGGGK